MIRYLPRNFLPVHIGICTTEKAFNKELKRLKIDLPNRYKWLSGAGTTHEFTNTDTGVLYIIICIDLTVKRVSREQIDAVYLHEVIHAWQNILAHIGEDKPGAELEAYMIQSLFQDGVYILNEFR